MERLQSVPRGRFPLAILLTVLLTAIGRPAEVAAFESESDDTRPNIVVLVADDLGWADVGYHDSPIPTPHIDRLAREGVELNQHYVAPVCTPTRAALLSGRYWSRFGNTGPANTQVLPFGTVTLGLALQSVGYETAVVGKWHLGSLPKWGPWKFGFDHSYGSLAGGVGPWNHRYKRGKYSRTWHRNGEFVEEEGHVTGLLTDEAVAFIETERDGPFFLYVAYTAVHHPLDEPEEWLKRGRNAEPQRPQYAACTMHLDDGIRRILEAVQQTGQRENTLVVFFSDNGGTIGPADRDSSRYPGEYPEGQPLGRNDPLRGRKGQVYEGGIRVPACVNWPGRLKPRTLETPIHVVDWMPTLCRLAGYEPERELNWDGRDAWPLLTGESNLPEKRTLYWLGPGGRTAAVRHGDWKLLLKQPGADEQAELYHLGRDPFEQENIAGQHPERLADLRKRLAAEMQRDNDALPGE